MSYNLIQLSSFQFSCFMPKRISHENIINLPFTIYRPYLLKIARIFFKIFLNYPLCIFTLSLSPPLTLILTFSHLTSKFNHHHHHIGTTIETTTVIFFSVSYTKKTKKNRGCSGDSGGGLVVVIMMVVVLMVVVQVVVGVR